jgi:hypothetical protein
MAIAMYGWSWLKPAGCAKTMLGRKEEEVEREEVERQLREVELQERVQMEMEEGERQRLFQAQTRAEAAGEAPGEQERDLDDEVPEAEEDEEEDEEEDLDDDVPEADVSNWHYDTRLSPEPGEGETGITDDVERSHLGDGLQIPPMFHAGIFTNERQTASQIAYEDEQAIANAMLEEDEMEGTGERNLDDEVPDAEMEVDEEGWEHTDTELEESEMDISILPQQQARHLQPAQAVTRSRRAATPATVESSVAETGRRSWLGGSPRRNLFGRNPGNAGNAVSLFTPPPAPPQSPIMDSGGEDSMRARRIARAPRRGANVSPAERENRDSLD